MENKVVLILVDGMTSLSLEKCGHPFIQKLKSDSVYNCCSRTVMPSVTLPCHMSLFHSVPPQRHGILSNVYVPQVRPVRGLFETAANSGKTNCAFYSWEELKDIWRPGYVRRSVYAELESSKTDILLTDICLDYIEKESPDIAFLYLGMTDHEGHSSGWMSEKYLKCVYTAWSCIEKVYLKQNKNYRIIVTADHGGHDSIHGTDADEDMTIPIFVSGYKQKDASDKLKNANIMDIAPTIANITGFGSDKDWMGKSLVKCDFNRMDD